MPERDGLITTAELAGCPRISPISGCSIARPISNISPQAAAFPISPCPGGTPLRPGIFPARTFSTCRANSPTRIPTLRFMMPEIAQLEAAFGRHGIGADSRVVLYSHRHGDVGDAVLVDAANRSASTTPACSTAVSTNGRRRAAPSRPGRRRAIRRRHLPQSRKAGYFVGKHDVLAASDRSRHRRRQRARSAIPQGPGAQPLRPARPHSRQRQRVRQRRCSIRRQRRSFRLPMPRRNSPRKGIAKDKRVIAYCGGGISATIDLFQLHRLGYDNLTLYDGSMGEWAEGCIAADRDGLDQTSGGNVGIRHDLRIGLVHEIKPRDHQQRGDAEDQSQLVMHDEIAGDDAEQRRDEREGRQFACRIGLHQREPQRERQSDHPERLVGQQRKRQCAGNVGDPFA